MKKLSNLKWFTLGIAVCLLATTLMIPALASTLTKTASLVYNDIKITLNGSSITPKDANGNTVEPFMIDGTTYLPVRAVANALGLSVEWDEAAKTVKLSNSSSTANGENEDIKITGATLDYDYGVPCLYLDFQNTTSSDITRLDIYVYCYDAYGAQVGTLYKGYSMDRLNANSTGSQYWDMYGYSGAQTVKFGVYKYQTATGTTVTIPENQIKWWKTTYAG